LSYPGTGHDTAAFGGSEDRLSADGFDLLHEACEGELVEQLLDASTRSAQTAREALGENEIGIGSAAGYAEIVQRSPGRWDVPIDPQQFGLDDREMPWWPLVASVLGEDAEFWLSGVVFSEPGSTVQYWHSDSPHEALEHQPANAICVLVALHNVPMTMGPTELARGSHMLTNHLSNPSLVVDELVYQHAGTSPESLVKGTPHPVPESFASPLAAGSCLVFDDRILHRGLANRSDDTRHVAYFTYRRSGYSTNTYFESQGSVHDT
jgi:hypothetical protein